MAWYGYVSPGFTIVTQDYQKVSRLAMLFPYSSFRKREDEEKAREFVVKHSTKKHLESIKNYGNCFKDMFVTVKYYITSEGAYYNINTSKVGYIKLLSNDKNIEIENRANLIKVAIKTNCLDDDKISSHAIAIYKILQLIGNLLDVELVVPDNSIYYLLREYTGVRRDYKKVRELIDTRLGEVSVTILDW